ncbi:MAG TPA: hypothetical protein VGM74_20120 [Burkholderiaceae bacterium]
MPVASFVLGFLIVAAAIHALLTHPLELYAEYRSEKLAMLDAMPTDFEFAAFGTSHVHNGFDPRAFDKRIDASAPGAKSVNLGIEGGSQTEQTVLAQRYLQRIAADPAPPQPDERAHVLLLEANAGVNFQARFLNHPRTINLYDTDAARLAFGFGNPRTEPLHYAARSAYALIACGLHYLNVGMLSNLVFRPALDRTIFDEETQADRRGLMSGAETAGHTDTDAVREAVADRPASAREEAVTETAGLQRVAQVLEASAGSKDVAIAFFVTPKLADTVTRYRYPARLEVAGGCVPIVDVANPALHPELYEPRYWNDLEHLNEAGAAVYSALLARRLSELDLPETRNHCKALDAVR